MAAAARTADPVENDLEDHLSAVNFGRISELIGTEVGIKLPPGKRLMVEGRLRKRIRELGHRDFDAYCDFLFRQGGLEHERVHLINAVTTNKTDFFREAEHFTLLEHKLVPALLKLRSGERNPLLKIWSVIARLIDHLRPQGYLVLGHSESMIGTSITMRQVAPAVFQKV